jgi:hypothetical protein
MSSIQRKRKRVLADGREQVSNPMSIGKARLKYHPLYPSYLITFLSNIPSVDEQLYLRYLYLKEYTESRVASSMVRPGYGGKIVMLT